MDSLLHAMHEIVEVTRDLRAIILGHLDPSNAISLSHHWAGFTPPQSGVSRQFA